MAVLIEALNVIIKDEAFNAIPYNRDLFLQNIPSKAFCSDGILYRVGFMDLKYVEEYTDYLQNVLGLTYLDNQNKAKDFVVVDMLKGPTVNCDWLGFKRERLFKDRNEFKKSEEEFSIAWSVDNYNGIPENYLLLNTEDKDVENQFSEDGISFPFGWTPDTAIYTSDFSSNPKDELEEISRDGKIITYKRISTGELVYVAILDMEQNNYKFKNKVVESSSIGDNPSAKMKVGFWDKLKKLFK